jgi:hypothetical protein
VAKGAIAEHAPLQGLRFARAKFRSAPLPATLVTRSVLHDRLTAGAGQRLTVVVGAGWRGQECAAVELGGGQTSGCCFLAVLR